MSAKYLQDLYSTLTKHEVQGKQRRIRQYTIAAVQRTGWGDVESKFVYKSVKRSVAALCYFCVLMAAQKTWHIHIFASESRIDSRQLCSVA